MLVLGTTIVYNLYRSQTLAETRQPAYTEKACVGEPPTRGVRSDGMFYKCVDGQWKLGKHGEERQ